MVGESSIFEKSDVKLQRSITKGNDNWFEKSGGSRNRGGGITERYNQGKRKLVKEFGRLEKSGGGGITEKYHQGKRKLVLEIGRFEKSGGITDREV